MVKILLVDDDRDLVDLLSYSMARAGFAVTSAFEAPLALRLFERERPDIAVLDVDLDRWSGFDLLAQIRQRSEIPVIMLTGASAERDKLKGFQLGADDYITKPFSHSELLARIRVRLARGMQPPPAAAPADVLEVGPLRLSVAEHAVSKAGLPLNLTVTEFRVLRLLMSRPGVVVPTQDIMRHVWGHEDPSGTDAVRVTIHRLRRKTEDDPTRPHLLHTIPGVGTMLRHIPLVPEPAA